MINNKGDIYCYIFTTTDVNNQEALKQDSFLNNIKGKFYENKGYIGKHFFKTCFWMKFNHQPSLRKKCLDEY
ncbi:MAG: hypothetical protein IJE43_20565 [Alphaproteobacteria bacterium]|nr:hypothetical protein [Alphaproteobacteria bacterium]